MKKIRIGKLVIALLILIIIMFNILLLVYNLGLRKVDNKNTKIEIVINPGMSVDSILDLLKENNLIRNKFYSKVYVKLGRYSMQAGTYDLSTSMSTKEIIKNISLGKVTNKYNVNLTFIEGKNIRDYVKVITNNTNNTEEDIYNLLGNEEYIDSLIEKYWFLTEDIKNKDIYYPLEGYLFPNTYTFKDKDVTVEEIFNTMLNETDRVLTKYKKDIESKNLNIHKFITLASVVELEGLYKEDRKEIAGVLYNRINSGDSIGCDATTYYAFKLDMSIGPLDISYYNKYNPYNTRNSNVTFPVGPIGNPGESAIEACINPKETNNYYYVADCKTGKTVFTANYNDHVNAVNRIKKSGCNF